MTPLLRRIVEDYVPVAEDLDEATQNIVDGTCFRAGRGPVTGSCTRASPSPPG